MKVNTKNRKVDFHTSTVNSTESTFNAVESPLALTLHALLLYTFHTHYTHNTPTINTYYIHKTHTIYIYIQTQYKHIYFIR